MVHNLALSTASNEIVPGDSACVFSYGSDCPKARVTFFYCHHCFGGKEKLSALDHKWWGNRKSHRPAGLKQGSVGER